MVTDRPTIVRLLQLRTLRSATRRFTCEAAIIFPLFIGLHFDTIPIDVARMSFEQKCPIYYLMFYNTVYQNVFTVAFCLQGYW